MRFQILPKALAVFLVLPLFGVPAMLMAQEGLSHSDFYQDHFDQGDHERQISQNAMVELLRKKVKYVFVIYQENRSFDSYFGTFPGADGLFSHSASQTPGFTQTLVNTDGSMTTIHPFRIGPKDMCPLSTVSKTATTACYAADTDDIDHSHPRMVAKMDVINDIPLMDKFAVIEELKYSPTGNPSLEAKQFGELARNHEYGAKSFQSATKDQPVTNQIGGSTPAWQSLPG